MKMQMWKQSLMLGLWAITATGEAWKPEVTVELAKGFPTQVTKAVLLSDSLFFSIVQNGEAGCQSRHLLELPAALEDGKRKAKLIDEGRCIGRLYVAGKNLLVTLPTAEGESLTILEDGKLVAVETSKAFGPVFRNRRAWLKYEMHRKADERKEDGLKTAQPLLWVVAYDHPGLGKGLSLGAVLRNTATPKTYLVAWFPMEQEDKTKRRIVALDALPEQWTALRTFGTKPVGGALPQVTLFEPALDGSVLEENLQTAAETAKVPLRDISYATRVSSGVVISKPYSGSVIWSGEKAGASQLGIWTKETAAIEFPKDFLAKLLAPEYFPKTYLGCASYRLTEESTGLWSIAHIAKDETVPLFLTQNVTSLACQPDAVAFIAKKLTALKGGLRFRLQPEEGDGGIDGGTNVAAALELAKGTTETSEVSQEKALFFVVSRDSLALVRSPLSGTDFHRVRLRTTPAGFRLWLNAGDKAFTEYLNVVKSDGKEFYVEDVEETPVPGADAKNLEAM